MTITPVSLRARKKTVTKERIYHAALELFRRNGFAATTVEDIAAAAEVSKGTFFNYFPSKEALLRHLGERLALEADEALRPGPADPALSTRHQLIALLRQLALTIEMDRERQRMAVLEFLKTSGVCGADPYRRLLQQSLAALLAAGQQRGDVDPALDTQLLGSTLAGAYLQQLGEWCAAEAAFPLAARLDQLVTVLWNGLGVD